MNVYVCSYIIVYKIYFSFVCIEDSMTILVQNPAESANSLIWEAPNIAAGRGLGQAAYIAFTTLASC